MSSQPMSGKFDKVELTNILDTKLGKIGGGRKEVTLKDYLSVTSKKPGLGRSWTQFKLWWNDRGTVDTESITNVKDVNTLRKIGDFIEKNASELLKKEENKLKDKKNEKKYIKSEPLVLFPKADYRPIDIKSASELRKSKTTLQRLSEINKTIREISKEYKIIKALSNTGEIIEKAINNKKNEFVEKNNSETTVQDMFEKYKEPFKNFIVFLYNDKSIERLIKDNINDIKDSGKYPKLEEFYNKNSITMKDKDQYNNIFAKSLTDARKTGNLDSMYEDELKQLEEAGGLISYSSATTESIPREKTDKYTSQKAIISDLRDNKHYTLERILEFIEFNFLGENQINTLKTGFFECFFDNIEEKLPDQQKEIEHEVEEESVSEEEEVDEEFESESEEEVEGLLNEPKEEADFKVSGSYVGLIKASDKIAEEAEKVKNKQLAEKNRLKIQEQKKIDKIIDKINDITIVEYPLLKKLYDATSNAFEDKDVFNKRFAYYLIKEKLSEELKNEVQKLLQSASTVKPDVIKVTPPEKQAVVEKPKEVKGANTTEDKSKQVSKTFYEITDEDDIKQLSEAEYLSKLLPDINTWKDEKNSVLNGFYKSVVIVLTPEGSTTAPSDDAVLQYIAMRKENQTLPSEVKNALDDLVKDEESENKLRNNVNEIKTSDKYPNLNKLYAEGDKLVEDLKKLEGESEKDA